MGLRQTISFFDKISKQIISIQVAESSNLPFEAGFWNTDTNQILLGKERFNEWEELTGHLERQIEFILKLDIPLHMGPSIPTHIGPVIPLQKGPVKKEKVCLKFSNREFFFSG